jgi:hypothetical protein
MVKKKNYRERAYANIPLLRFSLFQRNIMGLTSCYRTSKTGEKRAFHVVER